MSGKNKKKAKKAPTKEELQLAELKTNFKFWLCKEYEISFITGSFTDTLEAVYNGTYKGLARPIPPEDFWDMWQRKMPYLLKVYDKNKRMGKDMEGFSRMLYDLAILLSRYDSYLAWKEEQKQANTGVSNSKDSIDYNNLKNKTSKSEKIDISKILDEI